MSIEAKYATCVATNELEKLVAEFEAATLPLEKWNHRAHLSVALWYLSRHGRDRATTVIRENIKRYNLAHGIVTTKDRGYHETITLFYIHVISKYLLRENSNGSTAKLLEELFELYGDKNVLFDFYSKKRLMSWEARTRWVAPDLRPLD